MRISDWSSDVCSSDLINASRSLARITRSLTKGEPEGSETRHNIILRQIAFAHSMRCQLRRQSLYEDIDRQSVVSGKSVSARVDLGVRRNIKKKKPIRVICVHI